MNSPAASNGPYSDPALNHIYQLLFADNIDLYRTENRADDEHPWNVLFATPPSADALKALATDENTEARVSLLACQVLRNMGHVVDWQELLGIVVEVGLDEGLDVLAAYLDGSARYINYSGKMIVWDASTDESDKIMGDLFQEGETIMARIGPWDAPRKAAPGRGVLRLSLLVSDGLYFGEGPMTVLFNDPMAGPALKSATALMQYLVEHEEQE